MEHEQGKTTSNYTTIFSSPPPSSIQTTSQPLQTTAEPKPSSHLQHVIHDHHCKDSLKQPALLQSSKRQNHRHQPSSSQTGSQNVTINRRQPPFTCVGHSNRSKKKKKKRKTIGTPPTLAINHQVAELVSETSR